MGSATGPVPESAEGLAGAGSGRRGAGLAEVRAGAGAGETRRAVFCGRTPVTFARAAGLARAVEVTRDAGLAAGEAGLFFFLRDA
ncbi:MAG: hypothetical protein Q7U84_06775, partial [Polynucleobacter sp.]|nr:hypothetical protein [Polynucleobacter sp.]